MIHARIRLASEEIVLDPPPEQLHELLEAQDNVIWLDLESPTAEELGLIAGILGWEHLTVEDLTNQGQRAKLEQYATYVYLVMHALEYAPPSPGALPRLSTPEIDFVIGS